MAQCLPAGNYFREKNLFLLAGEVAPWLPIYSYFPRKLLWMPFVYFTFAYLQTAIICTNGEWLLYFTQHCHSTFISYTPLKFRQFSASNNESRIKVLPWCSQPESMTDWTWKKCHSCTASPLQQLFQLPISLPNVKILLPTSWRISLIHRGHSVT